MAIRTAIFGLLGWVLPALVAGALGWRGIWGSGGAMADFLIPIPVAGGALHVPSFALMLVAVHRAAHWSPRAASRLRALSLGVALTSAVLLWPPPNWRLQENALALFLLSDALIALLALQSGPRRDGPLFEVGALLALLAAPALATLMLWRTLGLGEDYRAGLEDLSPDLVLLSVPIEVKRVPSSDSARADALAWALPRYDPRQKAGVEVTGLRFVARDGATPSILLCLYEDGAPPRWLAAGSDCLAGFTSFKSRLARHAAAVPADTPRDAREYLAARAACTEIAFKPPRSGEPYSLASVDACERLDAWRDRLAQKYPALVR